MASSSYLELEDSGTITFNPQAQVIRELQSHVEERSIRGSYSPSQYSLAEVEYSDALSPTPRLVVPAKQRDT